jgi:Uma2 family endonuclease
MVTARITWHDVQAMPEDGKRYEAIGGNLYVTAAPSRRHQWVVQKLAVEFDRLLVRPGHGEVYPAPFGVEFPVTGEGVQPDFIFVSRDRLHIVGEDWVRGAPDLVVEILSPSTAARDRGIKLKLYRRQGVAEYWIVDPDAHVVDVWDLAGGAGRPQRYTDRLAVRVRGQVVGHMALTSIFRRT